MGFNTMRYTEPQIRRILHSGFKTARARGKKLSRVEELLLVSRTRMLLDRANAWAKQGRCPFWLEPTARFPGVHTQDYRFILTIEGGGGMMKRSPSSM